jgi:hypothetical protein
MWNKYGKVIVFLLVLVIIAGALYWRERSKNQEVLKQPITMQLVDRSNYGLYGQQVTKAAEAPEIFRSPSVWAFDNQADWKRFWDNYVRLAGTGGFDSEPKEDFKSGLVFAVLQGVEPSGGYYVTVDNALFSDQALELNLTLQQPAQTGAVSEALSAPYDIVWLKVSAADIGQRDVILSSGGKTIAQTKLKDILNRSVK